MEAFKFFTDPELDAKVRDVIGLYLNPPDKAIVLCVDEKSQVQALDRTAPILPLRPGISAKQTHDSVHARLVSRRFATVSGRSSARCVRSPPQTSHFPGCAGGFVSSW